MPHFTKLQQQMETRFALLSKSRLFITDVDPEWVVEIYLKGLPEEERQYHNCNCCKNFIRRYGAIVAIVDGDLASIWDFPAEGIYEASVETLSAVVRSAKIVSPFYSHESRLGTAFNLQLREGVSHRWEHFHNTLASGQVSSTTKSIESLVGEAVTTQQMFKRALDTISLEAIDTVLELIKENNLYRGKEHKRVLESLHTYKQDYSILFGYATEIYAWQHFTSIGARIRNTSIGTLLVALSEGKDLEAAVASYEAMVAPQNYRRPTALVTKGMLEKAEKAIEELGYAQSLQRRYAVPEDLLVSMVKFTDKALRNKSLLDTFKQEVIVNPSQFKELSSLPQAEFLKLLPTCESVEVLLENKHTPNLVTLVTESVEASPSMFYWDNPISWSYHSGMADSIKERVKAAGGSTEGELRISLAWFNYDDLDLHVREPNGTVIYFNNKISRFSGGFLDVDMNAGEGTSRSSVENIIFKDRSRMQTGVYTVMVNNFCKRETKDVGFEIEIESACGESKLLTFPAPVRNQVTVIAASIHYDSSKGVTKIVTELKNKDHAPVSKQLAGMASYQFQRVSNICISPNYWTNYTSGNRHIFFLLDKAVAPTAPRPFFNEFLKSELQQYRKVFELLGNRLPVSGGERQLSGLGFSSTKKDEVICRTTSTAGTKVFKIIF
jgi:hypothetical protein